MADADRNVLHTAQLYALFDELDQLVKICNSYDSLDSFLKERTKSIASGKLEKLFLSRINMPQEELAAVFSGASKLSGEGTCGVIILDDGWYVRASPKAWTHELPLVKIK